MKNILILICLLTTNLFSQTNEPTARTFNGSTIDKVSQDVFINGFEMSQHKSFDDLYNCNTHFGSSFTREVEINPSRTYYPLFKFNDIIYHINHWISYNSQDGKFSAYNPFKEDNNYPNKRLRTWSGRDNTLEGIAAIEWEPTLEIPSSQRGEYIKQESEGNTNKYVFGFSYISSLLPGGSRAVEQR